MCVCICIYIYIYTYILIVITGRKTAVLRAQVFSGRGPNYYQLMNGMSLIIKWYTNY